MLLLDLLLLSCPLLCLVNAASIPPAQKEADASTESQLVVPYVNQDRGPHYTWNVGAKKEISEVVQELSEAAKKGNWRDFAYARGKLWNINHPQWTHNLSDPNDVIMVRRKSPFGDRPIDGDRPIKGDRPVIPKFLTGPDSVFSDHTGAAKVDLWRTIFRVLIDRTGPDAGGHVELHGMFLTDDVQLYQNRWWTMTLPKLHIFKTDSPSDDGVEIADEMYTSRGIPLQSFHLQIFESDIRGTQQWLVNEDHRIKDDPKLLEELKKDKKKEHCAIVMSFTQAGFKGRVRRCIQYIG